LDSFCKNGGHSNGEVASINNRDMNNLTSNIQTAPDYESYAVWFNLTLVTPLVATQTHRQNKGWGLRV
jgi:hypothetical protein